MSKLIQFLIFHSFLSSKAISNKEVSNEIAQIVKQRLIDLTPGQITEKIELHYKILGLIKNDGEWVHYYFDTHGHNLFPR